MNKTKFKQCAIYTRVSTDIQAEKEFSSCESQEEKIRAFVKSQDNWQIAKVYTDAGYTGANTNRPALQELLEDIKGLSPIKPPQAAKKAAARPQVMHI